MSLLNVASARELREGDAVRLLFGAHRGKLGTVVGADLLNKEAPVVVQYKVQERYKLEAFSPNALEPAFRLPEREELEPLPKVSTMLAEGAMAPTYVRCGSLLCITLREDGSVLTAVPRRAGSDLRALFDEHYTTSLQEAVRRVLEVSFVTRRPHLIKSPDGRLDRALREMSPETAVKHLLVS